MRQASHICSPIFHCWLLSAQHTPTPSAELQHLSVSDFLLLLSDALPQLSWEVGVALQVSLFLLALALEYLLHPEQIRLTYSSPAFAYFWLLASPLSAYTCWASTSVSISPLGAPEKTLMFSLALHGCCSGCRQPKHLSKSFLHLDP